LLFIDSIVTIVLVDETREGMFSKIERWWDALRKDWGL